MSTLHPPAWSAGALLVADEATFRANFRSLPEGERDALPAAERAQWFERVKRATSHIDAGIKKLRASQEKRDTRLKRIRREPPIESREFSSRFTFVYPTDTSFDSVLGGLVKIANMKLMFGKRAVENWLESPDRRTVELKNVVFDPTGQADPQKTVNLFRGMRPPGNGGVCTMLLELLQYLCGEADQDHAPVTEWVLRWIAYFLQHLGAKMQTAIVMHGPREGAGKNLFWNAVRDIFGEYGSMITQVELESPYNSWVSHRLFLIANEVISRHELRHHVGRLKTLVTEKETPISEKYLPLRYEANHANLVFLTNELHALQIAPGDRRYMVIRTPHEKDSKFYQAVVDELAAGGAMALYRHLMEIDCGEFNEHTKPIMTQAKADLIEIGLSSSQQFWRELHDGLVTPLPYGPCLSVDLYRAYRIWCDRNGVKSPRQSNFFSHEFMSMNGVSRRQERVRDPEKPNEQLLASKAVPQRAVFRMGARSEAEPDGEWVKQNVAAFRNALHEYAQDGGLRRPLRAGREADGPNDDQPF